MSRFLNKKEEVIDFKLTSYGRYLLALGKFKPIYYSFYDDNIIYDAQYFGRSEPQSAAKKRIKDETQYLEGQVLFEGLEKNINRDGIGEINYFTKDVEPSQEIPRKDVFRFEMAIGDANLQGVEQVAPAWKVVSLESKILSSSVDDYKNKARVPQLHLTASYKLKTIESDEFYQESFNSIEPRKFELVTNNFIDNRVIYLESSDQMIYVEEMNTELLVENFDIEIFEFLDKPDGEEYELIRRKYFDHRAPQIVNGLMMFEKKHEDFSLDTFEGDSEWAAASMPPSGVEPTSGVNYYFDLLLDDKIDPVKACKGAQQFNRESYYIDIDFDCENLQENNDISYDIYGSAVEAEICLD